MALRWCTSCDDPFCESCWSLIHLRGKRLRHAYCEIDRKGTVSLNAIGADGQFAGTFKAGQTGAGYGSDYGVDAYASDYPGAEDYEIDPQANDWAEYMDETGVKYWYNVKTGMSQWDDPNASTSAVAVVAIGGGSERHLPTSPSHRQLDVGGGSGSFKNAGPAFIEADPGGYVSADGYASGGYEGGQGFGIETKSANPWTQYADDNGIPYWYNSITGESTYTSPNSGGAGGAVESDWMEANDEQGNVYYYNIVTGHSQYEYPY